MVNFLKFFKFSKNACLASPLVVRNGFLDFVPVDCFLTPPRCFWVGDG